MEKLQSIRLIQKEWAPIIETLQKAGAEVESNVILFPLDMTKDAIKPVDIVTAPFMDFQQICKRSLLFSTASDLVNQV